MLVNDGLGETNFLWGFFCAHLDSTKINFYLVQGCSNKEIFVSLKGEGQAYSLLYIRVNLIDLGQYKNKNSCYHNFKTRLGARPESQARLIVERVNVMIKKAIIIVLKSDSRVELGSG